MLNLDDLWSRIKASAKSRGREVNEPEDLTQEEYQLWQRWQGVLTKQDLNIEDLKKLLPAEREKSFEELIATIQQNGNERKAIFLASYASFIHTLTKILNAPDNERKALENLLKKSFKI